MNKHLQRIFTIVVFWSFLTGCDQLESDSNLQSGLPEAHNYRVTLSCEHDHKNMTIAESKFTSADKTFDFKKLPSSYLGSTCTLRLFLDDNIDLSQFRWLGEVDGKKIETLLFRSENFVLKKNTETLGLNLLKTFEIIETHANPSEAHTSNPAEGHSATPHTNSEHIHKDPTATPVTPTHPEAPSVSPENSKVCLDWAKEDIDAGVQDWMRTHPEPHWRNCMTAEQLNPAPPPANVCHQWAKEDVDAGVEDWMRTHPEPHWRNCTKLSWPRVSATSCWMTSRRKEVDIGFGLRV